jgi:hypothetical protein
MNAEMQQRELWFFCRFAILNNVNVNVNVNVKKGL